MTAHPSGRAFCLAITTFLVLAPITGLQALAREAERHDPKTPAARPQPAPTPVDPDETQGVLWTGEPGITETVAEIMARQAALDRAGGPRRSRIKRERVVRLKIGGSPLGLPVAQWPPAAKIAEAAPKPTNPQSVGVSFTATDMNDNTGPPGGPAVNIVPPDTMGDVGPTQLLVAVNGRIKVFDKAGNIGGLNADMDTFFDSVRGGQPTSDPHVRYDRLSQRWFVTIINVPLDGQGNATGPNRILIAVSSGSAITSSSSFTFFQFEHDDVGTPGSDLNGFADYDTLGVDKFALYIGVNMFNQTATSFVGTTGYVVNKASLLDGGAFTVTAFRQLAGNTCPSTGVYTPQGVNNDDPDATEGYFVGVDICLFGKLVMRRVGTPGGTPSISGNLSITQNVPTTAFPIAQVQPGGGPLLDALEDRLYAASIHLNRITGAKTLWTAHNIEVTSSGVGQGGGGRNGSRWYEIGSLTTTPAIVQAGTLFDSAESNPFGHWIPSVAANRQGHMALGASRAGPVDPDGRASAVVAGRLRTDAAGTTQAATVAMVGAGHYDSVFGGTERWGDYSQVGVDPTDGQTMWTFQEFTQSTSSSNAWGVRVMQLKAPGPATPASASPPTLACGHTGNVTITGTSSGGTEFFDPGNDSGGPGFPNRIVSTISGGVTVNSTTFVSATQATLNVSTGATAGLKNVTITNPDGQQATGNNLLNVVSGSTATVGGTQTICTGASTTVQATLTGATPWNLAWSDGTNQNGVTSSPAIRTVSPSVNTTYSINNVSDACGSGTPSGTTTVNIDNDPDCGGYFTVTPCRLVDTRADEGPALAAGSTRTFDVVNAVPNCGIPSSAKAVAVTLTAVDATTAGNLRLFPTGGLAPLASSINFVTGQTRGNNAIISLGTSGQISVLCSMATGSTNFVMDVNGYFE